jgi:hypothetical protein
MYEYNQRKIQSTAKILSAVLTEEKVRAPNSSRRSGTPCNVRILNSCLVCGKKRRDCNEHCTNAVFIIYCVDFARIFSRGACSCK